MGDTDKLSKLVNDAIKEQRIGLSDGRHPVWGIAKDCLPCTIRNAAVVAAILCLGAKSIDSDEAYKTGAIVAVLAAMQGGSAAIKMRKEKDCGDSTH